MSLDRERFCKVLALAESDQDGEALAAVRRASAMARAAGLSLGEAVGGGQPKERISLGSLARVLKAEEDNARLRLRVAMLEQQLASRGTNGPDYQRGYAEGMERGREFTAREFMGLEPFKEGWRSGFNAGQEAERGATNRAYSRGYADGQASVNLKDAAKPRQRKSSQR